MIYFWSIGKFYNLEEISMKTEEDRHYWSGKRCTTIETLCATEAEWLLQLENLTKYFGCVLSHEEDWMKILGMKRLDWIVAEGRVISSVKKLFVWKKKFIVANV